MFTVLDNPPPALDGSLVGTAPHLVYTPSQDHVGTATFYFKVNDGFSDSGPSAVTIHVVPGPQLTAECREDRIFLSWNISEVEQTFGLFFAEGFYVYRRTTPSGPYQLMTPQPLGGNVRTFSDTQVTANQDYYYAVTFYRDEVDPEDPLAYIRYQSPFSNDSGDLGPIRTCPRSPSEPTDIVFIIDNTASASGPTGGKLQILKDGVIAALDEIVAASTVDLIPDYRMALITPDNDQVHVRLNLIPGNRADCEEEIDLLAQLPEPKGNWDPESTDECILTAVARRAESQVIPPGYCTRPPEPPDPARLQIGDFTHGFTKARKVIVLITDAPPGGFCDPEFFNPSVHGTHALDIAEAARTNCIRIDAIQVPNQLNVLGADAQSVMQGYRDVTCGWHFQIPISLFDATSVKEAVLRMFYVPAACECP